MSSGIDFVSFAPSLDKSLGPVLTALPWLPAVFLGIGLAASSGLRAFLPLLLLSVTFKWHLMGFQANQNFAWLTSDMALLALSIGTVVEILGDKIPVVDHGLDTIGTLVRPAAGALAAAAVLNTKDPATAAILGIVLGAPLALGVHAAKAGTRGASTITTAGVGNPVLSVVEDIAALFLGAVSLLIPILVPFLLLIAGLLIWKLYKLAARFRASRASNSRLKTA